MGCAHWLRIPQGEAGHSGCLRVKVEGVKSRTHRAQCPDSLARVQPKIITAEKAVLSLLNYIISLKIVTINRLI